MNTKEAAKKRFPELPKEMQIAFLNNLILMGNTELEYLRSISELVKPEHHGEFLSTIAEKNKIEIPSIKEPFAEKIVSISEDVEMRQTMRKQARELHLKAVLKDREIGSQLQQQIWKPAQEDLTIAEKLGRQVQEMEGGKDSSER